MGRKPLRLGGWEELTRLSAFEVPCKLDSISRASPLCQCTCGEMFVAFRKMA